LFSNPNCWSAPQKCLLGLLLPVITLAAMQIHAGPAPYGKDFVRAGIRWSDAAPPAMVAAAPREDAGDTSQYELQVKGYEGLEGPYSDLLAEPLAAMAELYRERGDWSSALDLYRRASHVVRINDGLYSQRQVPLLRAQLDIYRLAGDMQSLDDRYDYFFRLLGRGEPPYTEIRVRATLEYLRWQREWLRMDLDSKEKSRRRLLALYRLNEQLIEQMVQHTPVDPDWYAALVLSQMRNLYLIVDRVEQRVEYVGITPSNSALGREWNEMDVFEKRLESLQRGAVGTGARLLKELIAGGVATAPQARARWYIELGDWYQFNDDTSAATEHYRQAETLLRELSEDARLREWLGRPVELPDNGAFWQPPAMPAGERQVIVRARFDVSARGTVRNVSAQPVVSGDQSAASQLRRSLKKTRFRPRFSGGEAEAVPAITRDYEVW